MSGEDLDWDLPDPFESSPGRNRASSLRFDYNPFGSRGSGAGSGSEGGAAGGLTLEEALELEMQENAEKRQMLDKDVDVSIGGPAASTSTSSLLPPPPPSSHMVSHFTQRIAEDIPVLRDIGFLIDFPKSKLGEGFFGTTYRGWYGVNAQVGNLGRLNEDGSWEPDVEVSHGKPFAVKIIDFQKDPFGTASGTPKPVPQPGLTGPGLRHSKETTETEKFILTILDHPNVIKTRYIVNMGEPRVHKFAKDPKACFISHERIYIFMEHADGGAIKDWLVKHKPKMSAWTRIRFVRELFSGMMYLHSRDILHGDVHQGNVLIFYERGRAVPKWTDFGQGMVSDSSKQYVFRTVLPKTNYSRRAAIDIKDMATIFQTSLLSQRHLCEPETQWETTVLDELTVMCETIRAEEPSVISQVYNDFMNVLTGDPQIVDEDLD